MVELNPSPIVAVTPQEQLSKLLALISETQRYFFRNNREESLTREVISGIHRFLYRYDETKTLALGIFAFQDSLHFLQARLLASPRPSEQALTELLAPLEEELRAFLSPRPTAFLRQAIELEENYPWVRLSGNFTSHRPFLKLYRRQLLQPTEEGLANLMEAARELLRKSRDLPKHSMGFEPGELEALQVRLDELEVQYLLLAMGSDLR